MKLRMLFAALIALLALAMPLAVQAEPADDFVIEDGVLKAYNGTATDVVIPDGVIVIGEQAFAASEITSVSIPSSVTTIESRAFAGCNALYEISIPDSVTSLGESMFYNSSVKTVRLPSGTTIIPEGFFESCGSLKSISLPSGLKTIGDGAFRSSGLSSVNLPDGLTTIGSAAFSSCYSLASVAIPDTVSSIGTWAFSSTPLGSVDLPDGITALADKMFNDCQSLTTVSLPSGLKTIGEGVFNASGLTSVDIPDGVTTIGSYAFGNIASLTSVELPASLTSIGSSAFTHCTSLKSVKLPSGLKTIGDNAFSNCKAFTSVTIPASVTGIGYHAFLGSGLTRCVILCESVEVDRGAFDGCNFNMIFVAGDIYISDENTFPDGTCFMYADMVYYYPEVIYYFYGAPYATASDYDKARIFSAASATPVIKPGGSATISVICGKDMQKPVFTTPAGATLVSTSSTTRGALTVWNFKVKFPKAGNYDFTFSDPADPDGPTGITRISASNGYQVIDAVFENDVVLTGESIEAAVLTGADAAAMGMYTTDGKLITYWKAANNSVLEDGLRLWVVDVAFNTPGYTEVIFRASKDGKTVCSGVKAAIRVVDEYETGVISAEFTDEYVKKGDAAAIRVETGEDAYYLRMYTDSGALVKTWTIGDNVAYTGSSFVWDIEYAFSGPGLRTMQFRASYDGEEYGAPVSASVLVTSGSDTDVTAAAFQNGYSVKGTAATATVKTGADAAVLRMYAENGKLIKTWAADKYSAIENGERVWTVKHTFTGAGNRTMTFRAETASGAAGAEMNAAILVTSGNDIGVTSAAFDADLYTKGTPTGMTVVTGIDAKYLTMFTESGGKAKTWAAADCAEVSGMTLVWELSYTFSGTGAREMTFRATRDKKTYGDGKSDTVLITSGNSIAVNSAKFGVAYAPKGTSITITVKTGADAKYLTMFNGSSKVKTWAAADHSVISGTVRVWTVSYAFSGAGERTMTFKASKDNSTYGTAKTAKVLITSGNSINVTSAKFSEASVAKGTKVTITVKTGADAAYLAMFTETNTKAKTWKASGNSTISGTSRIWTVTYTFNAAGDRSLTFKASKDNANFGTGKTADIIITAN